MHRVQGALDALRRALDAQLHNDDQTILASVAAHEPRYAARVQRLEQELRDLAIAMAAVREQIEPDPEFEINPEDIRHRLGDLTQRLRRQRAREADLVYEATGINLDDLAAL